jgi:hypothetical protein
LVGRGWLRAIFRSRCAVFRRAIVISWGALVVIVIIVLVAILVVIRVVVLILIQRCVRITIQLKLFLWGQIITDSVVAIGAAGAAVVEAAVKAAVKAAGALVVVAVACELFRAAGATGKPETVVALRNDWKRITSPLARGWAAPLSETGPEIGTGIPRSA